MPDIDIHIVADVRCTVGESPVWHALDQAWYWVDIPARRIWRLDASGSLRHWSTPEMTACIAVRRGGNSSGGLVAGMESGIFAIDLGDGPHAGTRLLAAPETLRPEMRFNDGRCDRQGRFWSGTMAMDPAGLPVGELYRYSTASGLSAPMVSELVTQNGLAWSPDGHTMYLSDSHPSRRVVWAFDHDPVDGVPSRRRVFADMRNCGGRPDGATIDVDGCYWVAGNDGSVLLRFTPAGLVDRKIALPVSKPSMPCLGGPDLDTFLVTSIAPGYHAGDTMAGSVMLVRAGVRGLPETPLS
jgi:sugar lactone lactonase YvrE